MLRNVKNRYKIALPAVSGILLVLAYPPFNLEQLAWIAFIPLFFSLENKALKVRFFAGYFFGVTFFSGIFYWLTNVSILGAIALVGLLSFWPAVFCTYKIKGLRFDIFGISALWVITEILRSYAFTGFPWGLLGHSQYLNLSTIQIADITGAYGISFLIVAVNFMIYAFLKNMHSKNTYAIICLFLLTTAYSYGFYRLKEEYLAVPLRIGVVQGNIPQDMKWDPVHKKHILDQYEILTEELRAYKPDLIVWPETSLPGILEDDEYISTRVLGLAKSLQTFLLVGTIRKGELQYYNSAYLISPKGEVASVYDKIHLVPFGEYMPFEKHLGMLRIFINKPIGDYGKGKELTLFQVNTEKHSALGDSIIRDTLFYQFGVLICFEDIFPDIARDLVRKGADILINITNDAWFEKTSAPYQHLQSSVFRAVENRVPVVRSANTGISCFINQKGRIFKSVSIDGEESFVEGYEQAEVCPARKPAFYTFFGHIFLFIYPVMLALALTMQRYEKQDKGVI